MRNILPFFYISAGSKYYSWQDWNTKLRKEFKIPLAVHTMFQPVIRCFGSRKWKRTNKFHTLNERHYSHDWKIPHTIHTHINKQPCYAIILNCRIQKIVLAFRWKQEETPSIQVQSSFLIDFFLLTSLWFFLFI